MTTRLEKLEKAIKQQKKDITTLQKKIIVRKILDLKGVEMAKRRRLKKGERFAKGGGGRIIKVKKKASKKRRRRR